MKRLWFVLFAVVAVELTSSAIAIGASPPTISPVRWDLRMIGEATVWEKLRSKAAVWAEEKAELQSILVKHPDSAWADDAAIMLAGGKASFDKDTKGAIADLQAVAERFPDGQTVVIWWDAENWCYLEGVWMRASSSLVFMAPDGTVRKENPFDKDGSIPQPEKEYLAYFDHLEKHPRRTPFVAKLIIATISGSSGDNAAATKTLETLVADARGYLAKESAADEQAAGEADGYYIQRIWRPEYRAYLDLAGYYALQGDKEKAASVAGELAQTVSPSGWNWRLNKGVGRVLDSFGFPDQAKMQYRLAVAGLEKEIAGIKARNNRLAQTASLIGSPDEIPSQLSDELQGLTELVERP